MAANIENFDARAYIMETAALNDDDLFRRLYEGVCEERQKKIDRYRFRGDKNLSLAAQLLLDYALAELHIGHIKISYGENGKPYADGGSVFFNLSHSWERAMCAVSPLEIGCDTERIKDVNFDIADRFFSRSECGILDGIDDPKKKKEIFFRLWTLKESFMKVTGYGMKLALDSFSIDLGDEVAVKQSVSAQEYYFKEYDLQDGYRYAVCSLSPSINENLRMISPRDCLEMTR